MTPSDNEDRPGQTDTPNGAPTRGGRIDAQVVTMRAIAQRYAATLRKLAE